MNMYWHKKRVSKEAPPKLNCKPLRSLRAEIQDLQQLLTCVGQGEITLDNSADYITKTMNDISIIMQTIKEEDYPLFNDQIRHLFNLWEKIDFCVLLKHPKGTYSAQEQTKYLNTLDKIFRDFVFNIGWITIPSRIQDWEELSKPGFYLPFHDLFADELPDPADRAKFLNALYYQPELIKGMLVEPDTGLLYRYSLVLKQRIINYLILFASVIAAIGILIGFVYIPIDGWLLKPADLGMILIGWLAVDVGLVVHVAVGITKKTQTQNNRPPIMAISQIPLLLDAKLGLVLFKILLTLIGFLGLVFATNKLQASILNSFLVGYSLDSVVELFSSSIEQKANAQLSTLKEQLGVK
jgi:hypothetical protein